MKIGNSGIERLTEGGAGSVSGVEPEAQAAASTSGGVARLDSVKLSSGSSLVALAKTSVSSTHTAKLRSIASQLGAGLYQADSRQTSQAVVQGHLRA